MIKKIKEIVKLKEEFYKLGDFIDIKKSVLDKRPRVIVSSIEQFIKLSNGHPVITERYHPWILETVVDGVEFAIHASHEEYETYKNSRATNTTKERSDA